MARKTKTKTTRTSTRRRATSTRAKLSAKRCSKKASPAPQVCRAVAEPKEAPRFRLSPGHYGRLVQEQAYNIWERRGRRHGRHFGDWLKAERLVRSRLSNN